MSAKGNVRKVQRLHQQTQRRYPAKRISLRYIVGLQKLNLFRLLQLTKAHVQITEVENQIRRIEENAELSKR